MATAKSKASSVDLTGFGSKDLTELARRALLQRKAVNDSLRKGRSAKTAKRKADRKAYLQAELAKLNG
jgi:hypothetical protein